VPDPEKFDARPVFQFCPQDGAVVDELVWPTSVPATWDDLGLVVAWRGFLRDPQAYFRHLF
jgi:hypothetical protein